MNCPFCDAEIKNQDSKFCPHCGRALTGASIEHAASKEIPKVQINQKHIGIIIGLIFIIGAAWGVSWFLKPPTPNKVVRTFVEALVQGKYETAYALFDQSAFIGRPFLSESSFEQACGTTEISDYDITNTYQDVQGQTKLTYNVILNIAGQRYEAVMTLLNKGSEKKPDWRVAPDNFIVDTTVYTLPGVTLRIGDDEITINNRNYSAQLFKSAEEVAFSFTAPGAEPITKTAKPGEYLRVTDLKPSQETIQTVKKIVKDYYEWESTTALKSLNLDGLDAYVKRNSKEWENITTLFDKIKREGTLELTIKDIKYSEAKFVDSLNTISLDIEATVAQTIKNSDGSVNSHEDWSSKQRLKYEKQSDGKWLIIEDRAFW